MTRWNVDSRSPICWRQPFSHCRMTRFKWWQTAALQTTAHDHQEGQGLWHCQTIEKTSLMTTNHSLPIWIEVANRYVHRYTSQGTYALHSTQGWYKFWFCWRRIFSLKHYPLQRHLRHRIIACRIKHPHILLTCRSTSNLIPRKQGLKLHLVPQNVKWQDLEGYYWIAPNAVGKVVGMQRSRTCKKSCLGADW